MDVAITCQVRAKPDPVISWQKDGQSVTAGAYYDVTDVTEDIRDGYGSVIVTSTLSFTGKKQYYYLAWYPSKHKSFVQHLYNVGLTSSTLANIVQMLYKCFSFTGIGLWDVIEIVNLSVLLSRNETLNQCCYKVGPPSATLARTWISLCHSYNLLLSQKFVDFQHRFKSTRFLEIKPPEVVSRYPNPQHQGD